MSEPYRDQHFACPACKAPMRVFHKRLVCDACYGVMLTLEDLATGVHDLTSILPTFAYRNEKPGKRACPHCAVLMTTCKLTLGLEEEVEKPRPELDRCVEHGIWFDGEELARVLEKVTGKGHGPGTAHKQTSRGGERDQGRWSAMFQKFGGHGGY